MKKTQLSKDRILTLRKSMSNQRISMEIIPQFSPQPYFVRKQQEQNKLQRVSSVTPRKNKFVEIRKYQSSKQKLQNHLKKNQIHVLQEHNVRKFNSPLKIQNILTHNYKSQREIKITNSQQKPQNGSEQNFSDQKLSSSKSVRFSNRIDDNLSVYSKRQGSRTPSILKNKDRKYGTGMTSVPSQRSFSVNNSFHSNHKEMKKKIQEESNANNITKRKYESLLKNLQMQEVKNRPPLPGRKYLYKAQQKPVKAKFQDDIFPPVYSSIFPPNPKNNKGSFSMKGKQVEWKRISEIFPNRKLVIYDKPEALPKYFDSTKQESKVLKIRIVREKNSYASQFIVTALNSIKNNEDLLGKIFENQQVNEYGIYMVKIFQENAWKYIIIDDFIPVVRSTSIDAQSPYVPAFVNIKPQTDPKDSKSKRRDNGEQLLPIWPLLLEKAYANYYSSYEALTHGQVLDMVSQFCGISYQKVSLVQKTDPEEYLQIIDKLLLGLKNGNIVALAQLKDQLPMIPLHYKAEFCYSMITEQELFYYDPHQEYRPCRIKFYDLGLICTHLFLFAPIKYLHQITCTISKPKHKISPNLMSKINKENIVPRDIPTIRKFQLKSPCQCEVFIRQKQKRFLHRLGIQYIWLRAILIAKQYDGSYRWINGQYTNKKGISFNHLLDPGEYFIFLYPQWGKEKYNHQIHVSLYCNEQVQTFQRVQFDSKQKMLQQACTDLAQKCGKLKQLNQYICTYNFIDKKSAIIIENVVNQLLHGEVNIMRSIIGLKSLVDIVPVNDEFYEDLKQKCRDQGAEFLAIKRTTIDVKIPKSQSYSVILKMKGGIDNNFFKVFTFGS